MLKKFLLSIAVLMSVSVSASAAGLGQLNIFNHLGADLSVGSTGIGVELSTPITNYVQMRAGLNFMPGIKFNANIHGNVSVDTYAGVKDEYISMDVTGNLARTQGDVIFNVYPFGSHNSLFVAAGAYFGGKSIIKLDGHSDRVAELQEQGIINQGWVEVGDYKLDFEENGNIRGGLVAQSFRPYLGLGYGRPCPKGRVGFMIEAGVQFMGHMKVCQGRNLDPVDISDIDNNDDWQKWMDKLTVYPVIKLTLTGRLF